MNTATLETSKKLQEAGINIDNDHSWMQYAISKGYYVQVDNGSDWEDRFICLAPTFDELWSVLPAIITKDGIEYHKELGSVAISYREILPIEELLKEKDKPLAHVWVINNDDNIAESAAKLLLLLHDNGHLTK